MKEYLVIRGDEDGNPTCFMNQSELDDMLAEAGDCGVDTFLSDFPKDNIGCPEENPQYWAEGVVLLLKTKVLVPKVKTTAFKL